MGVVCCDTCARLVTSLTVPCVRSAQLDGHGAPAVPGVRGTASCVSPYPMTGTPCLPPPRCSVYGSCIDAVSKTACLPACVSAGAPMTPSGASYAGSVGSGTPRRRSSSLSMPSPASLLRRPNIADAQRAAREAKYAAPPPRHRTIAGEANR